MCAAATTCRLIRLIYPTGSFASIRNDPKQRFIDKLLLRGHHAQRSVGACNQRVLWSCTIRSNCTSAVLADAAKVISRIPAVKGDASRDIRDACAERIPDPSPAVSLTSSTSAPTKAAGWVANSSSPPYCAYASILRSCRALSAAKRLI